jgi:hypothetical protein
VDTVGKREISATGGNRTSILQSSNCNVVITPTELPELQADRSK